MNRKVPIYSFVVLTACYFILALVQPIDPSVLEHYHISALRLRVIDAMILIPLIVIWGVALVGAIRIKEYAHIIRDTKEGWAFTLLARGLMVLVYGLPISSIIAIIFTTLSVKHPDLLPTAVITKNYANLILSLVPLCILAYGARLLVLSNKRSGSYQPALPTFIAPVLIMLSTMFTWLAVVRPTAGPQEQNPYYLPNWLIIFTIIIPYIATWTWGILASYYLFWYRSKVRGSIYKQAFSDLAKGIAVVTSISLLIQFLTTILTQINNLQLAPILLLVYLLVVLYALGFWFISRGSARLKRIEEV